jgi:hypothetical protein
MRVGGRLSARCRSTDALTPHAGRSTLALWYHTAFPTNSIGAVFAISQGKTGMARSPRLLGRTFNSFVLGVVVAGVAFAVSPTVTLVSQADDGTAGSGTAQWLVGLPRGARSVSDDGRFVVFQTAAPILGGSGGVTYPVPGKQQVYLRNTQDGTTALVSHSVGSLTTAANHNSTLAVISGDGRYVAFASQATDLTATGDNPATVREVYRYAVASGTIVDVSFSSTATDPGHTATSPRISADGSVIVFASDSPDLIPGQVDANSGPDLFVWHGTLALASRAQSGWTTAGDAALTSDTAFDLSANGRYLTFSTEASNLVAPPDGNGLADLFQLDRLTGTMRWVSKAGTGGASNGSVDSAFWSSPGGDWVAFSSNATNLVPGVADANAQFDAFLWERSREQSSLVTHTAGNPAATAGSVDSGQAIVSDDGRYVLFRSGRSDFIAGLTDANAAPDLFLFDRLTDSFSLVSHQAGAPTTAASAPAGQGSGEAVLSGDGGWVAFTSDGRDLVAGMADNDTSTGTDVFFWQRASGAVTLASHALASLTDTGNGGSSQPQLTPGGTGLIFRSTAQDLTAAPDSSVPAADVFAVLDLQPNLFADSFESGDAAAWAVLPFPPNTVLTGTPPSASNATTGGFSFVSDPPGGLFECSVDGAAFASCATPFTTASLPEGDHAFAVRAKTADGEDASPAEYAWRIDLTAPQTAIHTGPSSGTPSTSATFTFSSNEGDATYQCQLDGSGFSACTSPHTRSSLTPGVSHTFQVRAIEAAGNLDATPASWTWSITP